MPDLRTLVDLMAEQGASDLHLKPGSVPHIRVAGNLQRTDLDSITPSDTEELAKATIPADRLETFITAGEVDFAVGMQGLGRFRLSVMRQRGSIGIVIKRVVSTPPSFEELGLPIPVRQLAERREGLLLVTGPANAGKSTTVASMLDHINQNESFSIMCVENPIEMLHQDRRSFVTQREVGTDTATHLTGLQQALRHDPDVIYIDRIDSAAAMALAMSAAHGRLVITALPSLSSEQAIQDVIDYFPIHQEPQTRRQLASVLQGVISQRLILRADGEGRVGAFEFMVMTPRIHDSIVGAKGATELKTLIESGDYYGMQTMDQHLALLNRSGIINAREALSAAVFPHELRVQLQHG